MLIQNFITVYLICRERLRCDYWVEVRVNFIGVYCPVHPLLRISQNVTNSLTRPIKRPICSFELYVGMIHGLGKNFGAVV